MKSKSVVLMVVSLGFGLIAAIGISQVMGNNSGNNAVQLGQVLVASVDLKHGDDLTEENIKIEHWPVQVIPENAARDFEQIAHKKVTTRLSKSLPIMMGDTINASEYDSFEIPKGYKLFSIKASAEETVSGLMQPGDRVDVIGVVEVREPGSSRGETVAKTFLKKIEVFAVDGKTTRAARREGGGGNAIISVLVTEKQSELIVHVQKVAKIRLVLRGESDDDDEEGFTDYAEFKSVIGANKGQATEVGPSIPEYTSVTTNEDSHSMKVWIGNKFSVIEFNGEQRVVNSDDDDDVIIEDNDSDDFERPEEIESGLEEDQYPGE